MTQPAVLLLRGLFIAAIPLAVYLALPRYEPRLVGLFLLAALLLRAPRKTLSLLSRHGAMAGFGVAAIALLGLAVWKENDPVLVLAYPVAVSSVLLLLFAGSLLRPPSIVERIARLQTPDLPPAAVVYTRRVTQVWCVFFILNGGISAWTAVAASREAWLLYNGLISYLLMGALFGGELLYRRRHVGAIARQ
jgi:uncharacterized membrane protein